MEKEYHDLTANEVKGYMTKHREDSYQLIDVRFPEEYTEEHLPGAILIPLDELETRFGEVSQDKNLIIYCLSGKRSVAASTLIASNPEFNGKIYNMLGGILAWKGMCLPDMPEIKVFGLTAEKDQLLYQAMNLEKGAHKFYEQVVEKFAGAPFVQAIESLVHAEEVHANMIYSFWAKTQTEAPPFEEVYSALAGDILEGGKGIDELTARLEGIEAQCTHVIDMAMSIEYAAYDLYRNMAHLHKGSELEEVFLLLCQAEKAHMRTAAEALALCGD